MHSQEQFYSSLDLVLSHWAYIHLCLFLCILCSFFHTVYVSYYFNTVEWTWWDWSPILAYIPSFSALTPYFSDTGIPRIPSWPVHCASCGRRQMTMCRANVQCKRFLSEVIFLRRLKFFVYIIETACLGCPNSHGGGTEAAMVHFFSKKKLTTFFSRRRQNLSSPAPHQRPY